LTNGRNRRAAACAPATAKRQVLPPKRPLPRLCLNALPLQTTMSRRSQRFLQTAAVHPQQLFTWPSDRANYVAAAKIKKTQEKWINAYCLRLFASVSYFTHARRARLYGLTGSKAARGRMPGKCCQRTGPLRPAERGCARGTRGALAGGDFAEDGRTNANCSDFRHASQSG